MTQVNRPSGISAVTFFRLLPRALIDLERAARVARRGARGSAPISSPDRYLPVSEFGSAISSSACPAATISPPWMPAPGPMSTHIVGGADGVLVVLDHDHGVAEVAQALQRFEQARIVALVQADRRLVQHVEHAGQARADLRGQPDALALAARQRAGGARQREVVEADVDQELQPLADLLQDAHGDLVLLGVELLRQLGEPLAGALDRHARRPRRCACRRS